jgi:hypothetical protein
VDPEDQTVDGVVVEEAYLSLPSVAGATEPTTEGDTAGSEVVDVPEEAYPLVSGDDVFLSNPRTIVGLADYYALKETLSWTNATKYWPDIGQTDWVVLYESAILTSETPTVSIVKGDTANLTITGGKNLIFLDSSELTINQIGGVSEIYYDPSSSANISLNITNGVSALSQISIDSPTVLEKLNSDGSRTIKYGAVTVKYQTGTEGDIYFNDMISGSVVKAVPTFTLRDSPVPTPKEAVAATAVENTVQPPQSGASAGSEVTDVANVATATRPKPPMTIFEEDTLDVAGEVEEDPLTYFEDDVLVDFTETDIVSDYFSLSSQESWKYAAEVYRASDQLTINIAANRQNSIQKTEQNFEALREDNADNIDTLLAMRRWEELMLDDILDLFYVD